MYQDGSVSNGVRTISFVSLSPSPITLLDRPGRRNPFTFGARLYVGWSFQRAEYRRSLPHLVRFVPDKFDLSNASSLACIVFAYNKFRHQTIQLRCNLISQTNLQALRKVRRQAEYTVGPTADLENGSSLTPRSQLTYSLMCRLLQANMVTYTIAQMRWIVPNSQKRLQSDGSFRYTLLDISCAHYSFAALPEVISRCTRTA